MLNTKLFSIFVALVLLFSMACSTTQSSFQYDPDDMDNEYRIGKSDVLEVSVWKEEELTKTVKVRQDGMISLPLIDNVRAAGKTTGELKNIIQEELKEYIGQPTVSVIVVSQESKRYYILGEVNEPGDYELTKDLTVLQSISYAGGFTEWADKANILLLRKDNGQEKRMRINYYKIVSGKNPEQNAVLKPDDTVVVQ